MCQRFFSIAEHKKLPPILSSDLDGQTKTMLQLSRFLKLVNPGATKALCHFLETPTNGLCFGFSLCHALMSHLKKLKWWEAALVSVRGWDGTIKTLATTINLPEADNIKTLHQIFEWVLNFLISQHADALIAPDFFIEDVDQFSILDPKKSYLEIYNHALAESKTKIEKIVDRQMVAGTFSEAQLFKLIDENVVKESICLIHRPGHTTRIGYDKEWIFYNPMIHEVAETFPTKDKLIEAIIGSEGCSLAIEMAQFKKLNLNNHPFLKFEKFLQHNSLKLIEGFGLYMMASHRPDHLAIALAHAKTNQAYTQITESLTIKPFDYNPALFIISQRAPECLSAALDCMQAVKDGPAKIAEALKTPGHLGWTGLHIIARYAHHSLSKALAYAAAAPNGLEQIAAALSIQADNAYTGLHMVAQYAPEQLGEVLSHAHEAKGGDTQIAAALAAQDDEGWTGLKTIAVFSPQYLRKALNFALLADDGEDLLQRALHAKNKKGFNAMDTIRERDPEWLASLMELEELTLLTNRFDLGLKQT